MFRTRTLFSRISIIGIVVLIIVLVLLNTLSAMQLRTQKLYEAKNKLVRQTTQINFIMQEYWEDRDLVSLTTKLYDLSYREDCLIWIVNLQGQINNEYLDSASLSQLENYREYLYVNMEVLQESVMNGEGVWSTYDSNGLFYEPIITAGCPLTIENRSGDQETYGYVYLHMQITDLKSSVKVINQQSIYVALLGLFLTFMLSFWVTRWIARPLYDMNQAARELARGNFKKRIPVRDNSELGQLTRTFNMMAEELEKYEDTRESFVGNVSHELKSPLTSIQGFVQGMVDGTISEDERDQYLDIVLLETRRMNTLISDLLDLVKIESEQFPMNMTVWDVNELIRRILINQISKIEDKNIELAVNIPDEQTAVFADQDRIAQVLTNLLDNAVKFCEESGTIKIWTYESEGKVIINIANTGQIIPEEDLKFIFDRFFKVDKSHNRKAPGTGIGLSIVKEIINQHKERIWVNSQPEAGTVFTFTLALADENREEQRRSQNPKRANRK